MDPKDHVGMRDTQEVPKMGLFKWNLGACRDDRGMMGSCKGLQLGLTHARMLSESKVHTLSSPNISVYGSVVCEDTSCHKAARTKDELCYPHPT